jgi:hypothetical protein
LRRIFYIKTPQYLLESFHAKELWDVQKSYGLLGGVQNSYTGFVTTDRETFRLKVFEAQEELVPRQASMYRSLQDINPLVTHGHHKAFSR